MVSVLSRNVLSKCMLYFGCFISDQVANTRNVFFFWKPRHSILLKNLEQIKNSHGLVNEINQKTKICLIYLFSLTLQGRYYKLCFNPNLPIYPTQKFSSLFQVKYMLWKELRFSINV